MTDNNRPGQRRATLTTATLQGDDDGDGQQPLSRTYIDLAGLSGSHARSAFHSPSGAFCW